MGRTFKESEYVRSLLDEKSDGKVRPMSKYNGMHFIISSRLKTK